VTPQSRVVRVDLGSSFKPLLGTKVLLFLRTSPIRLRTVVDYSAQRFIQLEDPHAVADALEEARRPYIPHVASTTSYQVFDWDDLGSHPFKVPTKDPRELEIERVLEAAWGRILGP